MSFQPTFRMKVTLLIIILFSIWTPWLRASDCVILLHGLARSEYSFSKMEEILTDSGYVVINNSYPSTKYTIEELAQDFIPTSMSECQEDSIIHFVTHSMGGILLREYLSKHTIDKLGRTVMLGPPNKGSEVTDRLKTVIGYELINGPAGMQLGTDSLGITYKLGEANFEVGIIAGTKTFNPILSTMLPNPDDGKVSVENTKLEGMTDHLELPVTHTFMMKNKDVIDQVIYFLKNGAFIKNE